MRRALVAAALVLCARPALAGSFDVSGNYTADPRAVAVESFDAPERYVPDGVDPSCEPEAFTIVEGDDALDSRHYATVKVAGYGCAERFVFDLPKRKGSYVARMWTRHGALDAYVYVLYPDGGTLTNAEVMFSPTGRTTTDGWVELETNAFPIDGAQLDKAYLHLVNYSDTAGVDVDALEVIEQGDYVPQSSCQGLADPACSSEEVCVYGRCALARLTLPILPTPAFKDAIIDGIEGKLQLFYGGVYSRAHYLPAAIATLEGARSATTAWQYWGAFERAIHELHDWHTDTYGGLDAYNFGRGRLNACFFEGDADLSHGAFPRDALYDDILVSHAGPPDTSSGLKAGDRLVAVDGVHPIAWARALIAANWDYHVATDPHGFADFAEALGGRGGLILKLAHDITVLRCDAATSTCGPPETILVADMVNDGMGEDVFCDNRPLYHLDGPDPTRHIVFDNVFVGPILDAAADEKILGMTWDSLDGQGDPASPINAALLSAVNYFRLDAKGVILDHRAGNGGTLDSATNVTTLVRPPGIAAALRMPIEVAGDDGPKDAATGIALFEEFSMFASYGVGSSNWASNVPVALILHRDGSASDYMPYAMKGSPNTRLFGPHATSGAFSTFINFNWYAQLSFQFASGDTIAPDGTPLIGTGVEPDEIVLPKQSDLLAGKDTLFDAALAWVRAKNAGGP